MTQNTVSNNGGRNISGALRFYGTHLYTRLSSHCISTRLASSYALTPCGSFLLSFLPELSTDLALQELQSLKSSSRCQVPPGPPRLRNLRSLPQPTTTYTLISIKCVSLSAPTPTYARAANIAQRHLSRASAFASGTSLHEKDTID